MRLPKFKKITKVSYSDTFIIIEYTDGKGKKRSDVLDDRGRIFYRDYSGHFNNETPDLLLTTARCKNERIRYILKELLRKSL